MTPMTRATPVKRRNDLAVIHHTDQLIVLALDQQSCEPLAVFDSGVEIWRQLNSSFQSIADLTARVATELGVDADVIEPDVVRFVSILVAKGAIECDDDA
jgi:hypothetical protein